MNSVPAELATGNINAGMLEFPEFVGYNGWESDADISSLTNRLGIDYAIGDNIVILSGTTGPWFYRQKFGEYAGLIGMVQDWPRASEEYPIYEEFFRQAGYWPVDVAFSESPQTADFLSLSEDELMDKLFHSKDPMVQAASGYNLPAGYISNQI